MAEAEERLLMLIDDEPAQCRLIASVAARDGWRSLIVKDSQSALAELGTRQGLRLSAVIVDQWVPGDDACDLIAELKRRRPALPILMLTTSASPLLAVEAMRAGATDYLIKPVRPERILQALRATRPGEQRGEELQQLTEKMPGAPGFEAMIGAAPNFRAALAIAAKAARAQTPLLIEGDSGTGKEMLVRAIHAASPRAKLVLRSVSVAGVPDSQLGSVLFGHERGAFPGAFDRQIGAFQHAEGGTVVLDDIDRLPPAIQERLVRFLTHGDIQPLGARHRLRLDVRLIACSNSPLAGLVAAGSFHPELMRLLSTAKVALPPLRERLGDIPALTRHFLGRIAEQPGLRSLGITDQALALLAAYDWPGNVRQLQAVLFRAAVFCDGDALTGGDFPNLSSQVGQRGTVAAPQPEGVGVMLYSADGNLRPLEEIEADVIRLAIGHYRGRMSEVARRLGIGRSTLYRRLGELGIDNAA